MRRVMVLFLALCLSVGAARAADPAEALLAQLRALAPEARAKLAQTLAAANNPHAIRPLVTLLSEADAPFAAAITLNGVPYVTVLMQGVARYGAAAVAPLSSALAASKSAGQRALLIKTLAATRAAGAVQPLLGLLKHPPGGALSEALATQVGEALRQLGAPGIQGLTSLLNTGKEQAAARAAAMRALVASGKQALPALAPLARQAVGDAGVYARLTITELGPIAVPLLLEMATHPDAGIRRWAMAGLRLWADPGAFAPIVARLADPDAEVRMQAAAALGENLLLRPRAGVAVDPLVKLLTDPDPRVRDAAARALGNIGDPKAAPALRGMLAAPTYTDVAAAAIALGQLKDPQAITTLLTMARVLDSPARFAVLTALQASGDARAAEVMLGALGDPDGKVRALAASTLGALRTPGAVDSLVTLLQGDGDGAVRTAAAQALGHYTDPKAADALLAAWAVADGDYQPAVALGLSMLNDPRALPALLHAAGTLRLPALAGLAASRDPQAVSQLLTAVKDKDARARLLAVQGLASSGDPRALPALLAALKDTAEQADGYGLAAPVRQAAAAALGHVKDPKAASALIAALNDRAPGVAHTAAQSLAAITGQSFGYDAAAWKAWLAGQAGK